MTLTAAATAKAVPRARHTRNSPGSTLAGRYLRRFWQPIYRADDLPVGRTQPLKIMNEDLTLYRGEGGDVHQ